MLKRHKRLKNSKRKNGHTYHCIEMMISINNQPSILSAFNPIATPFKKIVVYTVRKIHLMSIKAKNNNKNSIFFIRMYGIIKKPLINLTIYPYVCIYWRMEKMDIKPEIQYDISLYLVLFKRYMIPLSHVFFFQL